MRERREGGAVEWLGVEGEGRRREGRMVRGGGRGEKEEK